MTLDPKANPDARLAYITQRVKELNKDGAPILAGPFTSELGFEAIYWTPFLAWFRAHVKDFESRAIIVTRGGATRLYSNIAAQGIDAYSLRTVTEVRRASLKAQRRSGIQKQVAITAFDEALLADVRKAYKVGYTAHVLHPTLMYWACEPFMTEQAGMGYLRAMCDFAPLPAPDLPPDVTLPEKFVAVKFYARHTFPYPAPDVAEFVKRTVATLAAQVPVVVLQSSDAYDDHTDIAIVGQNVTAVGKDSRPEENLWLQAAVVSKATAFVGTYGGMAQLALRMSKPSISFYTTWRGVGHAHFSLNSWISKGSGVPFLVGSLNDHFLWSQVTGLPAQVVAPQQMVTA